MRGCCIFPWQFAVFLLDEIHQQNRRRWERWRRPAKYANSGGEHGLVDENGEFLS